MIAIIDYDVGNLAAVANMLRRLGLACVITSQAEVVTRADRIILPGNGSFDACIRNLRASGLVSLLEHQVFEQGTPILGICVGAQMMGLSSEEGGEPGLGWLDMRVRRFPEVSGLPVPHMGWNQVTPANVTHPITRDLAEDSRFYFVHSYYMEPSDPGDIMLRAQYGIEFTAGVARGNIAGVQFHPEKSHRFGKRLLASFARGL